MKRDINDKDFFLQLVYKIIKLLVYPLSSSPLNFRMLTIILTSEISYSLSPNTYSIGNDIPSDRSRWLSGIEILIKILRIYICTIN